MKLDLDDSGDWSALFVGTTRVAALVALAVACGLMVRYYLTRPKMPVKAFVGFGCWAVALFGAEFYKIANPDPFRWWFSPFVILGSIAVIWGVWPAMQWRHGEVPKKGQP